MKEHLADIEIEPAAPETPSAPSREAAKAQAREAAKAKRDRELLATLTPAAKLNEPLLTYALPPFLTKVEILPWSRPYNYYQSFLVLAEKLCGRAGTPCPPVDYFAYIPQYENLSRAQMNYYLYFRTRADAGEYLPPLAVSAAYVMLYIYEIINLPHRIPPEIGIVRLVKVWLYYRDKYRELNKYMAEWLCDYCLIHRVPLPPLGKDALTSLCTSASLREFYYSAQGGDRFTGAFLAENFSAHDYRAGRNYQKFPADYDRHIPQAMDAAAAAMGWDKSLETRTSVTERDAFCGALCTYQAKRRIRVSYMGISHTAGMSESITQCVRYAENCLRALLKIGAKLKVTDTLPPQAKQAIDDYFAPLTRRQKEKTAEVPEWEKYYEAVAEPLDPAKSHEIETASWENAARLGTQGEDTPTAGDTAVSPAPCVNTVGATIGRPNTVSPTPNGGRPMVAPTGSADDFAETENRPAPAPASPSSVPHPAVLTALLENTPFAAACLAQGHAKKDLDRIAGEINEYFADRIGDAVLEPSADGWQLVADYIEDVKGEM